MAQILCVGLFSSASSLGMFLHLQEQWRHHLGVLLQKVLLPELGLGHLLRVIAHDLHCRLPVHPDGLNYNGVGRGAGGHGVVLDIQGFAVSVAAV